MKIKISEPGYAGFTGNMGPVLFEDGVSVEHVSTREVNLLSALLQVVNAETDAPVGALVDEAARWNDSVEIINLPTNAESQAVQPSSEVLVVIPVLQTVQYTREELEKIADEGGISAMRDIADPLGVKSTSIAKLIDGILGTDGETASVTE